MNGVTEKVCEIYFADLTPEKQDEILAFHNIKKPEEGNFDVFPVDVLCGGDVEESTEERGG